MRSEEKGDTWELVAETFDMTGETCLFEIEDFETAMDESGFGTLKSGDMRYYPKDERSADREKRGLLKASGSRSKTGKLKIAHPKKAVS